MTRALQPLERAIRFAPDQWLGWSTLPALLDHARMANTPAADTPELFARLGRLHDD